MATLTLVAIVVGTLGPGYWSVDGHVGALQDLWGWPGFGIAAGVGALGAAGLLGDILAPGAQIGVTALSRRP